MSRFSKSLLSTVMLFAYVSMRTVTSWEGEPIDDELWLSASLVHPEYGHVAGLYDSRWPAAARLFHLFRHLLGAVNARRGEEGNAT